MLEQTPSGWATASLSDIAQINPPLDRCIINDSIEINFVPMRAVEPEGGGLLRPETRPYGEVKKGYTAFLSGDVIMAKITPCMENGKTTVVPELRGSVCFGSTEFHVIRSENGVEPRWIANYLLKHETRRVAQRKMTGGVGQMRVPAAFLNTAKIPLPPTAEQQRIADTLDELFSDLDAAVAALERVQQKLAHYRAAVLKAAVEGTLTAEWREQHPATESASILLTRILAERRRRWEQEQLRKFAAAGKELPKDWRAKYKEPVAPDTANLPPLPERWCWATIDQLSSLVTSGSRGWKEFYAFSGAMFIRSQDIRTDRLSLAEIARVELPPNSEGTRTKVAKGDLLVTITGANVAKAALVEDELPDAYVSQHVGLIRLIDSRLADYVHLYTVAPSGGRSQLLSLAYGAGKPGLNLNNLRELPIPLPPFNEQESVVEIAEDQLSVIEHIAADVETKLKSAHALRQSILRHAFTGQLVPQDPRDEPAAELLKRIAAEREERARQAQTAKRTPAKPKTERANTRRKRAAKKSKTKENDFPQ